MNDIIISDLSVCQPADRLDRGYRYGTRRLIDYETEGFAGTMVYSGPGMGSEPLALPLNREGDTIASISGFTTSFSGMSAKVWLTI